MLFQCVFVSYSGTAKIRLPSFKLSVDDRFGYSWGIHCFEMPNSANLCLDSLIRYTDDMYASLLDVNIGSPALQILRRQRCENCSNNKKEPLARKLTGIHCFRSRLYLYTERLICAIMMVPLGLTTTRHVAIQ